MINPCQANQMKHPRHIAKAAYVCMLFQSFVCERLTIAEGPELRLTPVKPTACPGDPQ